MTEYDALSQIITLPVIFGTLAWAFKTFLDFLQRRRKVRLAYDLQSKVLDRCAVNSELAEVLTRGAGWQALDAGMAERSNPQTRIIGAVQAGVVLVVLSLGFLVARAFLPDAGSGFAVLGVLGLALGLGFVLAAVASLVLSRNWGLIGDKQESGLPPA